MKNITKLDRAFSQFYLRPVDVGFVVILLSWLAINWNVLTFPVLWQEVDYLRFIIIDNFKILFTRYFYYFADGHPPLLSLSSSLLLRAGIPLWILRVTIFIFSSFGIYYCVKFARHYQTNILASVLIIFYVVFSPVHLFLLGGFIGDMLGMLFLFGWAYHRLKDEKKLSFICLLIALGIRESHFLVPLSYIITWGSLNPKKIKACQNEILAISLLALYYCISKLTFGSFYNFTGASKWNFENYVTNFDAADLTMSLRLVIPFLLSMLVLSLNKSRIQELVFSSRRFYILLFVMALLSLGPYLKVEITPRILSPFILIFFIPIFMLCKNERTFLNYTIAFACCLSLVGMFFIDTRLYDRNFLINHNNDSAELVRIVHNISIEDPDLSVISAWPYYHYLKYPILGHTPKKFHPRFTSPLFHQLRLKELAAEIGDDRSLIIIQRSGNTPFKFFNHIINSLCFVGKRCSKFQTNFKTSDPHFIYYKNISTAILEKNFKSDDLKQATTVWAVEE